jgi:hypothetical protein
MVVLKAPGHNVTSLMKQQHSLDPVVPPARVLVVHVDR